MPTRLVSLKLAICLLFVLRASSSAVNLPLHRRQSDNSTSSGGNNGTTDGSGIPSNTSTPRGKAGLAWPNGDSVDIQPFAATGKVSWYYTWSVWPIDTGMKSTTVDLEFVPLLWGNRTITEFTAKINDTLSTSKSRSGSTKNVTALLGMNEPEQPGQSNMSPAAGVDLWLTHIEPFHARGLRLGSPAVSSGPEGKVWMENFFKECNGRCTVDFVAMHWYGINADAFIAHLWDYWYTFNRTLWVTEWACHNFVDRDAQCSEEDVVQFMNKTQSFMDTSDFVERYAWFGAMKDMQGVDQDNALMDNKGVINSLGRQYINATGDQVLTNGQASLARDVSLRSTFTLVALLLLLGMYTSI